MDAAFGIASGSGRRASAMRQTALKRLGSENMSQLLQTKEARKAMKKLGINGSISQTIDALATDQSVHLEDIVVPFLQGESLEQSIKNGIPKVMDALTKSGKLHDLAAIMEKELASSPPSPGSNVAPMTGKIIELTQKLKSIIGETLESKGDDGTVKELLQNVDNLVEQMNGFKKKVFLIHSLDAGGGAQDLFDWVKPLVTRSCIDKAIWLPSRMLKESEWTPEIVLLPTFMQRLTAEMFPHENDLNMAQIVYRTEGIASKSNPDSIMLSAGDAFAIGSSSKHDGRGRVLMCVACNNPGQLAAALEAVVALAERFNTWRTLRVSNPVHFKLEADALPQVSCSEGLIEQFSFIDCVDELGYSMAVRRKPPG